MTPLAFFEIGFGEMVVVGVVALLLFGGRLPDVMRTLGASYRSFRRGWEDLSRQALRPDLAARAPYQPTPPAHPAAPSTPPSTPAAASSPPPGGASPAFVAPAGPPPNAAPTVAAPVPAPAAISRAPGATGSAPSGPPPRVMDDDAPFI